MPIGLSAPTPFKIRADTLPDAARWRRDLLGLLRIADDPPRPRMECAEPFKKRIALLLRIEI
jgi:hypothetical protein